MAKRDEKESKLSAVKFGIAGGIVYGLFVVLITIFSNYFPAWFELVKECYGIFGYTASFLGAILGLIYGFIDGFILTFVFAFMYNKLLKA